LIILLVSGIVFLQSLPEKAQEGDSADPAGLVLAKLQAEYLLGFASLFDETQAIASEARMLDVGTVAQRQRYMAFMIALDDPEAAKKSALKMRADLQQVEGQLTEQQALTQKTLDQRMDGNVRSNENQSLTASLGWFGTLVEANSKKRMQMESIAKTKVLVVTSVFFFLCFLAAVGFVGVIIFFVFSLRGSVQTRMGIPEPRHGIYAEVFVLWFILLVGLLTGAGILGRSIGEGSTQLSMLFSIVAFFVSLAALIWARVRGLSWVQIRSDIGWTTGTGVIKEFGWGLAGYVMMLPILGVGILLAILLSVLQIYLSGGAESNPFGVTGGGAHPIVVEIANGQWQLRALLLVFAVVAAPIVEETAFRGVLYRHLRSSTSFLGMALSIIGSVLLVSFIFAAIHPQGWVAIPALMSIAVGMNLMRELRGSLISSMVVHGMSNGIVFTLLLIFLS